MAKLKSELRQSSSAKLGREIPKPIVLLRLPELAKRSWRLMLLLRQEPLPGFWRLTEKPIRWG